MSPRSRCTAAPSPRPTPAQADWDAIGELVAHVDIPVLGNGDIWEAARRAADGRADRAAGVVVGRGCLGRPWLFRDLAAAFAGRAGRDAAPLGEVRAMMRRHAELLARAHGGGAGLQGVPQARVVVPQGLPRRRRAAAPLALVDSLAALDGLLAELDPDEPFPVPSSGTPRGRQGCPRAGRAPRGLARRHRRPWRHVREDADRDHRRLKRAPEAGRASGCGVVEACVASAISSRNTSTKRPEIRNKPSTTVLDCAIVSVSLPGGTQHSTARTLRTSPLSASSKGSALWHTIATSGTPMPAKCPRPAEAAGPIAVLVILPPSPSESAADPATGDFNADRSQPHRPPTLLSQTPPR